MTIDKCKTEIPVCRETSTQKTSIRLNDLLIEEDLKDFHYLISKIQITDGMTKKS